MPIIPPQLEKCGLLNHQQLHSVCRPPLGASLCYEVLIITSRSRTSWHKIDHVLIGLYQDSRSQSLNTLDLFPLLLPVTVVLFQPPSPDLADRDQMLTG